MSLRALRAPPIRIAAALGLLALACASTKLTSVYRSEHDRGGPFRSLLVMGLSPSEGARHQFEERFVERLRAHGVDAIPSVEVLPEHGRLERAQVEQWVRERGIDGVVVTHVVDVEQHTEVVPPSVHPSLYGYYGSRWGTAVGVTVGSGYRRERTVLRIETNLYDAPTGRLVWSAASRTFDPGSREEVIDELTGLVTERLAEEGLLPAGG